MATGRTVTIDSFPESARRHQDRDAIVCVDVLSTTTTLVTAVARGHRAYVAESLPEAVKQAERVRGRVAAAVELEPVEGFDLFDSPTALGELPAAAPLVLFSPAGTELLLESARCPEVLVASFRNISATVSYLWRNHHHVAILGAGRGEEFSCEDQMAAAWLGARLLAMGFRPEDHRTQAIIDRWANIEMELVGWVNSADLLRKVGRQADLDFVLEHRDDLNLVCLMSEAQVIAAPESDVVSGLGTLPGAVPIQMGELAGTSSQAGSLRSVRQ